MAKKQRKQKKSKKWLFWLLLLVLLIGAGVATYFVWDLYMKNHETTTEVEQKNDTTDEQENGQATVSNETNTQVEQNDDTNAGKKVKQYEGEDPNTAAELSGVVTSANVYNGYLEIWTNIDQFLSGGSCELMIQSNGQTIYTEKNDIVADVTTSYCEDFSVPVSALGTGNYQIIINLSSGGKTGVINGEANI